MASKQQRRVLVIQYEQFFYIDEPNDIREAVLDGLEGLRIHGGARVVGNYDAVDDNEFKQRALTSLTINAPVIVDID